MSPRSSSPVASWRRPARTVVARVGRIVLVLYLGLMGVLYSLQTRLIFPGAETQGRAEAAFTAPPGTELVGLTTTDRIRIVALFGKALTPDGRPHPDADRRPGLIFFYGNGMCLKDARYEFDLFRRLGVNVLIPEFVGYGMSGGRPSEAGCYASADAAYDHLISRPDVDRTTVVVAGWSLGAATAVDLASRRPAAGLVLLSAFTSMADMARRQFPCLPVSLLLRHRFESETKMPRVSCPVLIAHGREDSIIPYAMSDRLAGAARGPVTRVEVAGADHDDLFSVGHGKIFPILDRFLESLSRPRP